MIQINCTIVNIEQAPTLNLSSGRVYTAQLESASRAIFRLEDSERLISGNFWAEGNIVYRDYTVPGFPGAYEGPVLVVKPLVQELRINEDQFILPDGSNYNWKGNIDWMLYKRSLDGVNITPLLKQRFSAGSRCIATLMQVSFIERFIPAEYGQRYYDHMIPFASALKDAGFYWCPVVYADEQIVKSGHGFVYQVAEVIHDHYWIIPSLGNEWSKNGFNPSDFTRPNTNNLWSRGSEVSDTPPVYPSWDWKEWHPRRDWPKVLFGNDDMWYVKEGIDSDNRKLDKRAPCIASEPIGFWDHDVPNRRSSDPNLARVVGGTSVYFGRGSNFMSEQGLRCEMWDNVTYDCAVAQFAGINQF